MTTSEAFVLVDAGEGRWEIRRRGGEDAVARLWRTRRGYSLVGLDQRVMDEFDCRDAALRYLLEVGSLRRRRSPRATVVARG
jgi:hypothetical protein